jgi:hypothetical protein
MHLHAIIRAVGVTDCGQAEQITPKRSRKPFFYCHVRPLFLLCCGITNRPKMCISHLPAPMLPTRTCIGSIKNGGIVRRQNMRKHAPHNRLTCTIVADEAFFGIALCMTNICGIKKGRTWDALEPIGNPQPVSGGPLCECYRSTSTEHRHSP